jgi:hypothetical protein
MTVEEALSLKKGDYVFYRFSSSYPVIQALLIDTDPKLSLDGKRVQLYEPNPDWPDFNTLSSVSLSELELSYEVPTFPLFAQYVAMTDFMWKQHPERYVGQEKYFCEKYKKILDCVVRHMK